MLTLTLDILKLKDGVAGTVPWRTFTSILDFFVAWVKNAYRPLQCTDGWPDNKMSDGTLLMSNKNVN